MNKKIFCLLILLISSLYGHSPYLKKKIYKLPIIDEIPKIIHQIWVGNKPIPENYKKFMKTWLIIHPDWEYRLWTDEDVDDFPWRNKELFLKAKNPGMKSDIWRYEIVNQFGGLYVDTDMEAIRSFEPLHSRVEFYAGYYTNDCCIANGIFASKPNSPILTKIIDRIEESICCYNFDSFDFESILLATGPYFFTKMLKKILPTLNKSVNIILPMPYFQPVAAIHKGIPKNKNEIYNIKKICFAIDYNGCSWSEN